MICPCSVSEPTNKRLHFKVGTYKMFPNFISPQAVFTVEEPTASTWDPQ
uniref:Uncharacterized protein n=1 Tax=Physcomitrium patens TaxID=3218 RepID=A0A7I4C338_PHYPA